MRSVAAITLCLFYQIPPTLAAEKPGGAEGRVVDAASGEPIRKAVVVLRRKQESGVAAYTDAKGEFHFTGLEPGAYALSAEHDGYVAGRKDPPMVVTILSENTQSDVTVKLVRTGAVSGRVVDADGDPVVGASVELQATKGNRTGPNTSTNDRGEFRAYGIPPGKYRLWAAENPTRDRRFIGGEQRSYRWTYYPGTADPRLATTVQVAPGAELQGFDVALVPAHAVRVRGRVTGPADALGPFTVVLYPRDAEPGGSGESDYVRKVGDTFTITNVQAGSYTLQAMGALQQERYYADSPVEVGNTDIEGIELVLAAPQKVTGRVILPEGRTMPYGFAVLLRPREQRFMLQAAVAPVGTDGTFYTEPLVVGDYEVMAQRVGDTDDLYVSAIHMGDEDVLAKGLHIGGAAPAPLEIVLAANGGALQVAVANDKGDPIPQAHIILLPDPPRRAQRGLRGDCTGDARGGCSIRSIAPGDYHVFAFANNAASAPLDFGSDAAVKEIEKYGKAVTIAAGQQASLQLEPVPDDEE